MPAPNTLAFLTWAKPARLGAAPPFPAALALALIAATPSGCQPQRPADTHPGLSDAPRPHSAGKTTPKSAPPERWQDFEPAQSWARSTRFDSTSHFNGRFEAELRVPAEFRPGYEQIPEQRKPPEGMSAALYHYRPATDDLVAILVLSKKGSEWLALSVSPDGTLTDQDNGALCLRCHAEAQADYLFGLPADYRGLWASLGDSRATQAPPNTAPDANTQQKRNQGRPPPDKRAKPCPCRAGTGLTRP